MKSLGHYISESESRAESPEPGDVFAFNWREEILIESRIVDVVQDGFVIEGNDQIMSLLEQCNCQTEDIARYGPAGDSRGMGLSLSETDIEVDDVDFEQEDTTVDAGEYDQEGDMAKNELHTIVRAARKLAGMLDNDDNMPEWTQKKITKAADYVDTAADYISSQKERGVMEGDSEPNPVARAILHRIMMSHPSMLAQHGPEQVMNVVDDVAEYIGDVEEIGSSDVSGWVRQVEQMLGGLRESGVAEGAEQLHPETLELIDEYIAKIEPDADRDEMIQSVIRGSIHPSELEYALKDNVAEDNSDADSLRQKLGNIIKRVIASIDEEYLYSQSEMYQKLWGIYAGDVDAIIDERSITDLKKLARELVDIGKSKVSEAEYQGRKVPLGKPMRGDVAKSKVYVKDPKTGNVKKVNFGDPNMSIKKSNPERRKSFRARHNCDNPGPRTKARYWSCRAW